MNDESSSRLTVRQRTHAMLAALTKKSVKREDAKLRCARSRDGKRHLAVVREERK